MNDRILCIAVVALGVGAYYGLGWGTAAFVIWYAMGEFFDA